MATCTLSCVQDLQLQTCETRIPRTISFSSSPQEQPVTETRRAVFAWTKSAPRKARCVKRTAKTSTSFVSIVARGCTRSLVQCADHPHLHPSSKLCYKVFFYHKLVNFVSCCVLFADILDDVNNLLKEGEKDTRRPTNVELSTDTKEMLAKHMAKFTRGI